VLGSVFLPGAGHSIRVPADYSQPACGVRCSSKPGAASQLPVFGVLLFFNYCFGHFFKGVFVRFSKRGVKKRHKNFLEKIHVQKS
jgi:hypothetical protein